MSLEGVQQSVSEEKIYNKEDALKEAFFLTYVHEQLLENFEDALHEVEDVTDEELLEWKRALTTLSEEKLNAFLAIPHELKERRIHILVKKGREKGIEETVRTEAENALKRGFQVAYHCSPNANQPTEDNSWTVQGLEQDHRDDDLSMAYYSTDLSNLYRKKNPKYIYLVRADTGEDTTHRTDNDGSWGRAPKLDVISSVRYEDAMEEVNRRLEKYNSKEKEHDNVS